MDNQYIPDEEFACFLEEFGTPTHTEPASDETIAKYKGKLPDRLLEYWKAYGFCGFKNGLFWITNPEEYETDLETWFGDTPVVEEDAYYVIARTAFGKLFLWGIKTGAKYLLMNPNYGWLYQRDGDEADIRQGKADFSLGCFFGSKVLKSCDLKDGDNEPMFQRAVRKLGALAPNEMFAFVPALALGGSESVDSLQKVDIHTHLDILSQLVERQLLDQKSLTQIAFSA